MSGGCVSKTKDPLAVKISGEVLISCQAPFPPVPTFKDLFNPECSSRVFWVLELSKYEAY